MLLTAFRRVCRSVFFVLSFVLLWVSAGLYGQEGEEKEDKGIEHYGFVHNIAEDRQVEKIGGIYEPEGLDKYVKRHFDLLRQRSDVLEEKVDKISDQLKEIEKTLQNSAQAEETKDDQETTAKVSA